jgi:CTP:molybdopterin cytidylyltransferase MocA
LTSLVVLAAGLATRYGAAKQLAAVGPAGERLFDYAVFDALRAGCTAVVFVIRSEQRPAFEQDVLPLWAKYIRVTLAEQRLEDALAEYRANRVKPWGTAHALLAAASSTQGDVLVCNADDWYGASAYREVLNALRAEPVVHALAGYPLGQTLSAHGGVSRALCRTDADGLLQRIEEQTGIARQGSAIRADRLTHLQPDTLVSMNLWGFHASFLRQLEAAFQEFLDATRGDPEAEFRIPDVVNGLIRAGHTQVRVLPVQEEWFGLTYAADLPRVRDAIGARIHAGQYPPNLFAQS